MTRIRFIAEKGNMGADNVTILLDGIEELPKFLLITVEDVIAPIATGKAFLENGLLMVETELREEDFDLYPAIGFENLEQVEVAGVVTVKRSVLHNVSLQSAPSADPKILSIRGQLDSGEALLIYY
ncbi:MAG: hypothetical protein ABI151_01060 [Chitinophagaceae bacterium]